MSRYLACLAIAGVGLQLPAQDSVHLVPVDRVAVRVMRDVPAIELAPGARVRTVVGMTGSVSLADFDPGATAVLHHHTREQADLGLAGVLEMTLGTQVEALGPGAAVIVPPNVAHSIRNAGGSVATVLEFHTVRRRDLVPPRPAITFPAAPLPIPLDGRKLVAQLDGSVPGSPAATATLQGQTCTLSWRVLARGAAPSDVHPDRTGTERFFYVVRGEAQLAAPGQAKRIIGAGTLVVVPAAVRHVRMQAVGAGDVALAEFSLERR